VLSLRPTPPLRRPLAPSPGRSCRHRLRGPIHESVVNQLLEWLSDGASSEGRTRHALGLLLNFVKRITPRLGICMNGRCDLSYKRYPMEERQLVHQEEILMRVHPSQKVTNMEAAITELVPGPAWESTSTIPCSIDLWSCASTGQSQRERSCC
jgi:hypothetical protein